MLTGRVMDGQEHRWIGTRLYKNNANAVLCPVLPSKCVYSVCVVCRVSMEEGWQHVVVAAHQVITQAQHPSTPTPPWLVIPAVTVESQATRPKRWNRKRRARLKRRRDWMCAMGRLQLSKVWQQGHESAAWAGHGYTKQKT